MNTYEEVLTDIAALPSGVAGNNRDIRWLTQANVIGVSRDQLGRLEVFLAGPQLTPRTATLKSAIEFHAWHRAQGQPLSPDPPTWWAWRGTGVPSEQGGW